MLVNIVGNGGKWLIVDAKNNARILGWDTAYSLALLTCGQRGWTVVR